MSATVKLLFDECIPRPLVDQLKDCADPGISSGIDIKHFLELWPGGVPDERWVPRLIADGWLVISGDDGRKPNKNRGRKLPQLCVENRISLIVLSPAVHRRKKPNKLLTILSVWNEIIEILLNPVKCGNRYMIEPLEQGDDLNRGRITERYIRTQSPEPMPPDTA